MSELFDNIMQSLNEAIEDAKSGGKQLPRRTITVTPVKVYSSEEVRAIRKTTGMSQRYFAAYLGVSVKTVEAWEAGINTPSGPSSRILTMMEMDNSLPEKFPFVVRK
ncbi:MAG: helix-turn-helix domain-containing protein [Clostridia bacterium]|nr:helix-turn-helix domain-containing protein [Clostridia bacterium]